MDDCSNQWTKEILMSTYTEIIAVMRFFEKVYGSWVGLWVVRFSGAAWYSLATLCWIIVNDKVKA